MYRSATSVPIQEHGSEWPSSERKLQQTILDFAQKVWLMLFGNFSTAKKQKPLSSEWIYICIFADLILIGFVYWLCSGLVACIWRLFLFCNFATLGDPVQKRRRHPKPSQLHLSFKLLHCAQCTLHCTVHSAHCTLHTAHCTLHIQRSTRQTTSSMGSMEETMHLVTALGCSAQCWASQCTLHSAHSQCTVHSAEKHTAGRSRKDGGKCAPVT